MATSRNDPRITAAIDVAMAWEKSQVGKATSSSVWAIAYPQWTNTGYAWCGGFQVAAYKQAGVDLMLCCWWFYTPYIKTFAQKIGAWKTGGGEYGDNVLFDWTLDGVIDHVGASWPDPNVASYRSVEGNTSPGTAGSQSNGGGAWVRYRTKPAIRGWVDMRTVLAWMIDTGKWDGKVTGKPTISTPTQKDGFLMALSDAEQARVAARIKNIQDILTGYGDNAYVQRGANLPLMAQRVRDVKDYISGGGPRGEDDTRLTEILAKLEGIEGRLARIEGK